MKAQARSYVYWPSIYKYIKRLVSDCVTCQEHCNVPQSTELHPREWPDKPWYHLHTDFAGLFLRHMFLILVDAHLKWRDIYMMSCITRKKRQSGTWKPVSPLMACRTFLGRTMDHLLKVKGSSVCVAEWHSAPDVCTIPSSIKWFGRKGCADFQERHEHIEWWISARSGKLFLISIPCYTAVYNWTLTIRIVVQGHIKCPLDLPRPDLKLKVEDRTPATPLPVRSSQWATKGLPPMKMDLWTLNLWTYLDI